MPKSSAALQGFGFELLNSGEHLVPSWPSCFFFVFFFFPELNLVGGICVP